MGYRNTQVNNGDDETRQGRSTGLLSPCRMSGSVPHPVTAGGAASPRPPSSARRCGAAGNVTRTVNARGQALGLTWNLQRQLTSVSTNGVFAESYAYDPLGRRVATADIGGTVYHAYDGIHCVADLAPDGTLLRAYTWGPGVDNLLAVTFYSDTETNTLHAVTDPFGTVHALAAPGGTIAVSYSYDSWGNLLSVSGDPVVAAANRFTWQGREYSYATGLYCFRARWYDPAAGRWLSKDPIGLEGGLNLYEAFGNNPVCFRDPEGLFDLIGALLPMHSAVARKSYIGGSLQSHIDYANSVNICLRGPAYGTMLGGACIYGVTSALLLVGPDVTFYEIGQKTLRDEVYAKCAAMDPIERGEWLVEQFGWGKALLPQGRGWVLGAGKTLHTGPTPLGWVGVTVIAKKAYDKILNLFLSEDER